MKHCYTYCRLSGCNVAGFEPQLDGDLVRFTVVGFGLAIENPVDLIPGVAMLFSPLGESDPRWRKSDLTCSAVIVVPFIDAMMFALCVLDYGAENLTSQF
jgi:hypothetical protein